MKVIKQAVILAGGQGTRLRPLTLTTPKPMVRIHGKPFLEYIIELLAKNGIEEVVILVGYLHKKITNYFKDGRKFGVKIRYAYSPPESDTGTRLKEAKPLLKKRFLLLYGDNYWPLDLKKILNFYSSKNVSSLVTVYSNFDKSTKNNMYINTDGFVEVYDRSRKKENLNGVDIGFFILEKKLIDLLPNSNCSFEDIIIPDLIKKKQLAGFFTHHKYYGLSNLQRIPSIKEYFKKKKVVFLDRDGVLNKKSPKAYYITSWKQFEFLPKVKEALQFIAKKKYKIFIVTNQAGVAREFMTQKELDIIHKNLQKELTKIGVKIQGVYSCTHGWDAGCFCRKPKPGLFFKAAADYNVNLYDSYCIGDDERDIIAGKLAGCQTFLVTKRKSLYSIATKNL